MSAVKIVDDVFWVGVQDFDLRIFDIVMVTEYGTSYNAYVVKGKDKTAIIETVKVKFFDEYLQRLQEVVNLKDIDYLIMNHTEPDHAGSIELLLGKNPDITILASPTAITFLKDITNQNFKYEELKHGDKLDLGGKTLEFINAPFLHWPDSMFTYLPEESILFSCDFLGSHYAGNEIFNDLVSKDLMNAYKYYYDMILSPFKPYVLEGLDKIKDLKIDFVCTGHGPVLRQDIPKYMELYREWSTPEKLPDVNRPTIVMAYVSAYGYTEMLAEAIAEGITAQGEFEFLKYDLVYSDLQEVLASIEQASGILIGSPTINGDALPPIWQLLINLSPIVHGDKIAMAFGAYGWSGEAVPSIEARLHALRMKVLAGMRVKFKPSPRDLEDAFQKGVDFAKEVIQKNQDKSKMKWRCVVCGHIAEGAEPPEVCPACGVGKENFELMPLEDEFNRDSDEKFLIIGGGIAAVSAAKAIRERNKTAAITILTEEKALPYYRPMLSDLLGEELSDERLYLYNQQWYEEQQITVKTNTRVTSIDAAGHKVLADSESYTYNKLIIATGARSNVPPIKGAEQENVYTMRSLEDALQLKQAMKGAARAVVIGGGVLGLEAVAEMVDAGLTVSVLEHGSRLMSRQLDPDGSARLEELLKSKGVKLYLGASTEEITGDGKATGVKISTGKVLEADFVLLSTGVKPNIELGAEAGVEIAQGIIVDAGMRTTVSDIYAAGDVAQFGERVIGLWPVSMEMGRIAGACATGDWVEYKPPTLSTLLSIFDIEFFSIGDVNLPPEELRIIEINDPVSFYFKKTFLRNGVQVGEQIIARQVDTTESMNKLGTDDSGNKVHNKWKCRLCGYIHEGSEPPDECPVCGASKDMFDPAD